MALDLDAVRSFVTVSETGGFTPAARQLGVAKSRVSARVRQLEAELQVTLLTRSTRVVRLTADGETFLPRAQRLLADAEELTALFTAGRVLKGQLRVDLPVQVALSEVLPKLPQFLAAHPHLDVLLSTTDRRVDLVREGFDCVLRIGALPDSGLVARRLGQLEMMNYASPAYLARNGTPKSIEELERHVLIDYATALGSGRSTFECPDGKGGFREVPMPRALTVNGTAAFQVAAIAGLGIIQTPRIGSERYVQNGALVEVLPEHTCAPMPVSLVTAQRHVPRRVRAFIGWLEELLVPWLSRATS